ncbi:MAG TPA: cyclic nucleotide-binding domain-containing protein [Xanthomonadales bacterium]|nr:cyclic nucleotide-binding domain-containing protein [Xanthomonadales bacterium]
MVNISLFGRFVPLQSLVPSDRSQLAKQSSLVNYQPGQVIFSRGELARTQAFLIEGEIELQDEHAALRLRSTDPEARYALAPGQRRAQTALCLKAAQILFVDRELLDVMLTWSQTGGLEARELSSGVDDESHDWMTALLQSKAFLRIPPGNIAQIFASMQPVSYEAGQIILKQGDPGDFYYVITDGRAQVVLEDPSGNSEEELAQLGVGRAFGEEALVSGEPRNATVRALTRCSLMRLAGSAFSRLLKAPLMREVQVSDLSANIQLVDVRLPSEFERGHWPGAINVPLARLRSLAPKLDPGREYWVYCDTGRRSASAVFLLTERGFDAKLVRGGVGVAQLTEAA